MSATFDILIPWRATGCAARAESFDLLRRYYREHATVIAADSDPSQAFNVSAARNAAAAASTADVLVFLDADAFVSIAQVHAAVVVAAGTDALVKPFQWAGYLTEDCTRELWATGCEPIQPQWVNPPTEGFCGLGWAVSRRLFDAVDGFDPGFVGYGGEDNAFQAACELVSRRQQICVPGWAYSLWHPADRTTSVTNWDRARAYWALTSIEDYRALRAGKVG